MSKAKPKTIKDVRAAIESHEFPGRLENDTTWAFPTVESRTSRGALRGTNITVELLDEKGVPRAIRLEDMEMPVKQLPAGWVGAISTDSFQYGADGAPGPVAKGRVPVLVAEGKGVSPKTATNVLTQALRDAWSKYNKFARKAPADLRMGADGPVQHTAARVHPMLLKWYGKTTSTTFTGPDYVKGVRSQRKRNGHRMVVPLIGWPVVENVDPYSRMLEDARGLDGIMEQILDFAVVIPPVDKEILRLPPGCGHQTEAELDGLVTLYTSCGPPSLDGEVYAHGRSLQWISGQTRGSGDHPELIFYVFDAFWPEAKARGHDMPSVCRQRWLERAFAIAEATAQEGGFVLDRVKRVENVRVFSIEQIDAQLELAIADGYEGIVLRPDCAGYQYSPNNYHSKNVLKLKKTLDSEFAVVGYDDGDKGKAVGALMWICEVGEDYVDLKTGKVLTDRTFRVTPSMTLDERYRLFACLGEMVPNTAKAIAAGGPATLARFDRDIKGLPLTVSFAEYSASGIPTQGQGIAFRTYEGKVDPIQAVFADCKLAGGAVGAGAAGGD